MRLFAKSSFVLVAIPAAFVYVSHIERKNQSAEQASVSIAEQKVFGPGLAPSSVAPSPLPHAIDIRNVVFAVQANGDLVVDQNTPERLDMLVAGFTTPQRAQHMNAIEALATEGLSERVTEQALRTLRNYVAYRNAEHTLLSQPRSADHIVTATAMHERVVALRRNYFGAEMADAMFAQEEAASRLGLEIARIQGDRSLSEDDRAARIATLQRSQPVAPVRVAAGSTHSLQERIAELRQNTATSAQ